MTDERQLEPGHLVVQRMPRHAQVLRGRVDIEPARLNDWTWSRDGFALFLRDIDGWDDVSLFHGNLSKLSRGVVGEDVVRCAVRHRRAWGPEPPSGSAVHLTATALSRGNLESARAFRTAR